jgi:hypothetical protein
MANIQRLTERVKKMEEWVKENDMTGGPQGVLDTFVLMVNETRASTNMRVNAVNQLNNLRALAFEFIEQHELTEEWNAFLQEKEENAVQEQSPEEVPSLTEAEDGKEVGEGDSKGKKPSKKSKKD